MPSSDAEAPIRHSVVVEATPDYAFAIFTDEMTTWWPPAYTWSRDVLEVIAIEPREGGRCFERGPHDFECDWGRVLECEPPDRIVFTWQIGPTRIPEPDPDKAGKVEVHFEAEGAGKTRVMLEHRGFERHGEGAEEYRLAMNSEQGWPLILDRFAAAFS